MPELQTTLWGTEPQAVARRSDPVTSHEAAERVNRNGTAKTHAEIVLAAIRDIPGRTSAELAVATGLDRHEAARRCADLKRDGTARQGEPRKCSVNKTSAQTWFPIYRSAH
jgi:predicted HTH transcriptional regulator